MKNKFLLLFVLLWKCMCCPAQAVAVGDEVQELVKIADMYSHIPNLSFNISFIYADSLTPATHIDSLIGACNLSNGKSFFSNSQVELLKNDNYIVVVNKEDSSILVNQHIGNEDIFQAPLLDSSFRTNYVSSMRIIGESDSLWRMDVLFNAGAPYSYYTMRYDPRNGLISNIQYSVVNGTKGYDIPTDHVVVAHITMTSYSGTPVDPAVFNENKYVYRLNGVLYLQPAWNAYQLESN